jgi:hypothetical protein
MLQAQVNSSISCCASLRESPPPTGSCSSIACSQQDTIRYLLNTAPRHVRIFRLHVTTSGNLDFFQPYAATHQRKYRIYQWKRFQFRKKHVNLIFEIVFKKRVFTYLNGIQASFVGRSFDFIAQTKTKSQSNIKWRTILEKFFVQTTSLAALLSTSRQENKVLKFAR